MSNDDAFDAGYSAYWDGVDPDDNPFKPETPDQRAWDHGWSQAQLGTTTQRAGTARDRQRRRCG